MEGQGNIDYSSFSSLGANGAAIANNGVSLNAALTTVQLGNDVGLVTAALLNNREIPMNGFSILFSGNGKTATAVPTFKQDAAHPIAAPDMLFTSSAGAEFGRIAFAGNIAGDAGDIFIGRLAGSSYTNVDSRTCIGWRAAELATANGLTAIGYESGRLATGQANTFVGSQAGHNVTSGAFSTMIGFNSGLFQDVAANSTYVGYSTGAQVWAGRACDNNTIIGAAAGLAQAAPAFTAARNVIVGSLALALGGGYGNDNTVLGALCAENNAIGSTNTLIGANIVASGSFSNTTILGQGITCAVSNVAIIGRADQNVIIGTTVSPTDNGSKLQILGSLSAPIRSTTVATTLTAADHTLIITGAGGIVVTLPAANTATGRFYYVVNQTAACTFSINYIALSGAATNVIGANNEVVLQSDGTNWNRLVN